jgi:hypothetical protein
MPKLHSTSVPTRKRSITSGRVPFGGLAAPAATARATISASMRLVLHARRTARKGPKARARWRAATKLGIEMKPACGHLSFINHMEK